MVLQARSSRTKPQLLCHRPRAAEKLLQQLSCRHGLAALREAYFTAVCTCLAGGTGATEPALSPTLEFPTLWKRKKAAEPMQALRQGQKGRMLMFIEKPLPTVWMSSRAAGNGEFLDAEEQSTPRETAGGSFRPAAEAARSSSTQALSTEPRFLWYRPGFLAKQQLCAFTSVLQKSIAQKRRLVKGSGLCMAGDLDSADGFSRQI